MLRAPAIATVQRYDVATGDAWSGDACRHVFASVRNA